MLAEQCARLSLSLGQKQPGGRGHVCSVILGPQHSQSTWHKALRRWWAQPGSWLVLGTGWENSELSVPTQPPCCRRPPTPIC